MDVQGFIHALKCVVFSRILGIIAALVIIGAILFVKPTRIETTVVITNFDECAAAGFPVAESYPRQCTANGKTFIEEIAQPETDLEDYFVEQLWQKGTEQLGAMPIEGFDPDLYLEAFPNLDYQNFHNTEAYGGIWKLENGELVFIRDESQPITSADGTLTRDGILTLLENLKERTDLTIENEEDIDTLVVIISAELEARPGPIS